MKNNSFVLILGFMFVLLLSNPLQACVGRLLIVAVSDSRDQVIMGHMLSVLINERTGTTVNIIQPGDLKRCHETVLKGKADIYINYIGTGQAGKGGSSKVDDPQKLYTLVRQRYMENFGMIWLKPFGFQGPFNLEANPKKERATLAVPVTTKDVLRRFPVLDRLINKLGGRIDNNTMDELRGKTENEDIKEAVREFLKTQNLI
jgi:glycine betaine/choline ABC-type transport system substrate-binding protein